MNHQRVLKYLALGAVALIPTLVIAQQQANPPGPGVFQAGQLLNAGDVEQMRLALVDAIARLNRLESAGTAIRKAEIRQVPGVGPAPINGIALATADCAATELMLECSCRGISSIDADPFAGVNNTSLNLRRVQLQDPTTTPSCVCQALNSGSNADAALVAIATCLPI